MDMLKYILMLSLLPNHFHFAISICSEEEIEKHVSSLPPQQRTKTEGAYLETAVAERDIHGLVSTQWSRAFNSYTQAINKRFNRKGHLFHSPYRRSIINFDSQFSYLIYYLHHNSRKHGLVEDFSSDDWHSYHKLVATDETFLERKHVLDWFGGKEAFIEFHSGNHFESQFEKLYIE